MAWLHRYRTPDTPWIALDDTQEWFGQNTAQVMIVSGTTGFTLEHEDEFRRRLDDLELLSGILKPASWLSNPFAKPGNEK